MTQWTRTDKKQHQRNQKSIQIIPKNEHNMQAHPQLRFLIFSCIHLHDRSKSDRDCEDNVNHFICFGQQ